MFPADRKPTPISVEYDCHHGRRIKTFSDPHRAKSFFVSKFRAGKAPHVRSETMSTVETPKAATKKTTTPKKAAVKKTTPKKKAAPKKAAAKKDVAMYGIERDHDLPWNKKKVAIFEALKALGCISVTTSRVAKDIAAKAGVSPRDVRHYCYHAKAVNLTGISQDIEGVAGYGFYLTAKGIKVDLAKEMKK